MKLGPALILIVGSVASPCPASAFRIPLLSSKMVLSTVANTASATAELKQYAPQAAMLFNNMKTPASIIAGSMVPLALLAPVPIQNPDGKPEHRIEELMRRSYTAVGVVALLSEFICIIYATVAVNQLTETFVEPAASVWEIFQRPAYDISWSGTNVHFLFGMFSFAYLIGVRTYFNVGGGLLGRGIGGLAAAANMAMVSIVNQGVASGSGDGISYGKSIWSLFSHYYALLLSRSRGRGYRPLELTAFFLAVGSLAMIAKAIFQQVCDKAT